jgi:hypothetical protein
MESRRALGAVAGLLSVSILSMLGCQAPPVPGDPASWGVETPVASLTSLQPPSSRTAAPPISGGTRSPRRPPRTRRPSSGARRSSRIRASAAWRVTAGGR